MALFLQLNSEGLLSAFMSLKLKITCGSFIVPVMSALGFVLTMKAGVAPGHVVIPYFVIALGIPASLLLSRFLLFPVTKFLKRAHSGNYLLILST